jgi:hypothetical protein
MQPANGARWPEEKDEVGVVGRWRKRVLTGRCRDER